jgi:hypothetical protein
VADWVTISALASAGGTLALAGVTVVSVRSANRAARIAEQSLLAGQRPLLVPSRSEDPAVKVGFQDRDLYVAPGDVGFWQGSFRDSSSARYRETRRAVEAPQRMGVDILYGDFEGGQRMISRFMLTPRETEDSVRWYAAVGRYWSVDRPEPRERDD